jgi:hypothetical protein
MYLLSHYQKYFKWISKSVQNIKQENVTLYTNATKIQMLVITTKRLGEKL